MACWDLGIAVRYLFTKEFHMAVSDLIRTIESASANQALRAYRKAKRLHLRMELSEEGTSVNRRNFETRLEEAIERRLKKGTHKTREFLREELDDVCISYA